MFGMPQAAKKSGAVTDFLAVEALAAAVLRAARELR